MDPNSTSTPIQETEADTETVPVFTNVPEPTPADAAVAMEALRKERERSAKLAADVKASATRAQELEANLSKYKDIDPSKYADALDRIAKDEEKQLVAQQRWEELKGKSQKQIADQATEIGRLQQTIERGKIETEVSRAFRKAGGIEFVDTKGAGNNVETIVPESLVTNFLIGRLRLEPGNKVSILDSITGVPETNPDGTAKTLEDKMLELRQTSLSNMFKAGDVPSGYNASNTTTTSANGKQLIVYTKQQVREGHASVDISKIASGEAVVR